MQPAEGLLNWFVSSLENLQLQLNRYIVQHGPEFLVNLFSEAVVLLFWTWVAKQLVRLLANLLERAQLDLTLSRFFVRIAHAMMVTVVVIVFSWPNPTVKSSVKDQEILGVCNSRKS